MDEKEKENTFVKSFEADVEFMLRQEILSLHYLLTLDGAGDYEKKVVGRLMRRLLG